MSTATQARAPAVTRASRDAIPVVLAYTPFGLAAGRHLAATRIPPLIAWSSSPLLFSGAAQLLTVRLLDAGASTGVVVLGALVVNARMLLYGAALAPYTAAWPGRWRWLGACLLIDPVYALAVNRFQGPDSGTARDRLRYYLAAGLILWTAWMALTAAGGCSAVCCPRRCPLTGSRR